MKKTNKEVKKTKKTKEVGMKIVTRIMALFLVLMMLGGACYTFLYLIFNS